jgi:hypothetical protein
VTPGGYPAYDKGLANSPIVVSCQVCFVVV